MVSESDFRAFILENWQNSSKISDILITKVYIRNTLEFQSHVLYRRGSPVQYTVQYEPLPGPGTGTPVQYSTRNPAIELRFYQYLRVLVESIRFNKST